MKVPKNAKKVKEDPPKLGDKGILYSPFLNRKAEVEVVESPYEEYKDCLFWKSYNEIDKSETQSIICEFDLWVKKT